MMGKTKEGGRQSSLEAVTNIVEETGNKRKVSSACKLLQISQRVEEEEVSGDLELVAPVAICVTEVDSTDTEKGAMEEESDVCGASHNPDNSSSSSVSPLAVSPAGTSPSAISPSAVSPSSNISPSNVLPPTISPLAVSPESTTSKRKESMAKNLVKSDSRED